MKENLSRREFLRVSSITALGALAAGCATPTPEVIKETVVVEKEVEKVVEKEVPVEKVVKETVIVEKQVEVTAEIPSQLREAPMLAERVAAGDLPPVEERMPVVPKVANEMPASQLAPQIGRYGGTMRTLTPAVGWDTDVYVFCNEPLINTPGILGQEITGNICEAYEVSDDAKEFTFHLRKGLRWSDGTLVTTEDVRFAYEDVLLNTELTTRPPTWLKAANKPDGTPLVVDILDDYTFRITFDESYGGFLIVISIQSWRNYVDLLKPSHYLKQFHKDYASSAELDAAIKEANVEGWPQLFALKDISQWNVTRGPMFQGFPALTPWLLEDSSQIAQIFERNPYYFKVDGAGNQLPYIDRLESTTVADAEVIQLKMIAGETEFSRTNPKTGKMPLYKENEEKVGFTISPGISHATNTDLFLNLTYDDPVWREVVGNVKFRQALNMALNREEIADAVWYGWSSPPCDIFPCEFDPDGARALLDSIGMDKMDADGHRLGPDGNVFTIPFETGAERVDMVPTLELVVQFWEDIGIRTTMKTIDRALWGERLAANELQAHIHWTHSPLWYMGDLGAEDWGPLWDQWWNSGGEEGEEPPEDVKEFFAKMGQITALPPDEGYNLYYDEVLPMLAENLYYVITVNKIGKPVYHSNRLGNVSTSPDAFGIATNFSGEIFYFKD